LASNIPDLKDPVAKVTRETNDSSRSATMLKQSHASILILAFMCLFAPLLAKEGQLCTVYVQHANPQTFSIDRITDGGIVNQERMGISFNVIDSILFTDSLMVAGLQSHFDGLEIHERNGPLFLVDLSNARRITQARVTPAPALLLASADLFLWGRPGAGLNLKFNSESGFLWRIEGGLATIDADENQTSLELGLGPGWDYSGKHFQVSLALGYLLHHGYVKNEDREESSYVAFVSPALALNIDKHARFRLVANGGLLLEMIPLSKSKWHPLFSLGLRWNR
jgi:hypothetical protein